MQGGKGDLHTEAIDDAFKDQDGSSTAHDRQRLTGKQSVENTDNSTGDDRFHGSLKWELNRLSSAST